VPLTDPTDIPSLDHVFGHNPSLMKALGRAHITSVVPVMLLPKHVLMEFNGIGERTATYITGALAHKGLGHHHFNEKLCDFVDEQFGCLEKAPVMVLSVVTLRDNVAARPYYVPLQLLQLIDDVNPRFSVGDLLSSSPRDLLEMVEERVVFGPLLNRLKGDVPDINWRLSQWDPDAYIGVLSDGARRGHLSLVNS